MHNEPHNLPPLDLVVVGPEADLRLPSPGLTIRRFDTLAEATSAGPEPAVWLIWESALADEGAFRQLEGWLHAQGERRPPAALVHHRLGPERLASLMRSGLLDVVPITADPALWEQSLARLVDAAHDRSLRADAALTQQLLNDSRRRLRHEAQAEADSLLATQAELEWANSRLSDHMEQVSLLYRFGRELSHAVNWDDTLREILQNLASFVGAVGGALVLRTAAGGPYAPRQTYRWDETAWDKVLLRINRQIDAGVAGSLLAPGVFSVGRESEGQSGRITALPLEHHNVRLGMLLLLFEDPEVRRRSTDDYVSFLQMVQVMLSEEVAAAQMLDRLRDVSTFNTRLLETVSSAIWVCNSAGRTIFVNRSARLMLGLDATTPPRDPDAESGVGRGRMLDRPLTGGAQIDDLPELFLDGNLSLELGGQAGFEDLLGRDLPFLGEGHVTAVDGHQTPVRVRTAPMAGRGRDERWLLLVVEDISEARRLEAARRRAEQLEGLVGMSATLAHEIRNPLMGLSAQAELLAETLPEDDRRRDRIDLITGEVERINQTITDMLQYVRPCQPRREDVDLVRVVRNCLELARPRALDQDVDLDHEGPVSLMIKADPAQIQQVILNLVFNAVDASPEAGEVVVRLSTVNRLGIIDPVLGFERPTAGIIISVEDDGPGFGDVKPEKLFQPFFTTKTTGTGLGLAYSRKVIEAHDGDIRAERHEQRTCMRVLLPRETAARRALAGEAS